MQRTIAIVLAACNSSSSPPPPSPAPAPKPVATVSADAAIADAAPAFCFAHDLHGALTRFDADDAGATLCLATDKTTCASVAWASGAYRAASAPPADTPAYEVRTDDGGAVSLCKGDACVATSLVALAAPPDGGPPPHYDVSISDDAKLAVASVPGTSNALVVLDVATGKERGKWTVADGSPLCVSVARFVGPNVYVSADACAGSGARAWLYSPSGTRLAAIASAGTIAAPPPPKKRSGSVNEVHRGGAPHDPPPTPAVVAPSDPLDVRGGAPVHVSGSTWAVPAFGATAARLFDASSGSTVRTLSVSGGASSPIVGNPAEWTAPALVVTKAGKLAFASGAGVSLVDPASGHVEHSYALPACR